MTDKPDRETWDLAMQVEQLLEGTLPATDAAELQNRIREEAATREYVARLLRLHGEMKASVRDRTRDPNLSFPLPPTALLPHRRLHPLWFICAAILALAATMVFTFRNAGSPAGEISATLEQSKFCRWGESSLPTTEGASLTAGHYELAEGMARFRFANGTTVVLEGPSYIEIVDGNRCRLRKGSLMAEVPSGADGFTVEIPGITISAGGSQFGVSADGSGKYVIQAIRNEIGVSPANGSPHVVREGERLTEDQDDPRNLPALRSSESANLALSPAVL
ncbi:MAG: hypothetical protein EOP87_14290, partial [Verrucomicrobiaceae bacterium]